MKERLKKALYGGLYDCSPGSGNDQEQTKRIENALEIMEEEALKRIERRKKKEDKDKPETFKEKTIEKGGGK